MNSTFGKCCPCEKKGEGEEIINKETGDGHQSTDMNSKLENNLINNVDNLNQETTNNTTVTKKNKKKKKKNDIQIDINAIVSDTNSLTDENKTKIINLFDLLLKNNVICKNCVQNTAAENKIILVYDVKKKIGVDGYDVETMQLKFGYCNQHKQIIKCSIPNCKNGAYYILLCGHTICEKCLNNMKENTNSFYVCNECHAVCCNMYYDDHFYTHIWCNKSKEEGHYVCYKGRDNESPYGKKDKNYFPQTWVCPDHGVKGK